MPELWSHKHGLTFSFKIPKEILNNTFIPTPPRVQRDPSVLWAPFFRTVRLVGKEHLSKKEKLACLRKEDDECKRREKIAQAERDRTICGTTLFNGLVNLPEVMTLVLKGLDQNSLVCYALASKTCAKQALTYVTDAKIWDFNAVQRMNILEFLYDEQFFPMWMDFCHNCEMMGSLDRDRGTMCDACCGDDDTDEDEEDDSEEEDEEEEEENADEEEEE